MGDDEAVLLRLWRREKRGLNKLASTQEAATGPLHRLATMSA
jgi:hypothetical protein